jgi:hypothetical protein
LHFSQIFLTELRTFMIHSVRTRRARVCLLRPFPPRP